MKRGQGHVEIVLSFVLFLGFVLFIFLFMNPFSNANSGSKISDVQTKINSEISTVVGKMSVKTDNCYTFTETGQLNQNYQGIPRTGGYLVYFSNEVFDGKDKGCTYSSGEYELGAYTSEELLVYEKIEQFVLDYQSDDSGTREDLGISGNFDFEFRNLKGEKDSRLSVEKKLPTGVEIEAKEIPVSVINKNGEISPMIWRLRAWK